MPAAMPAIMATTPAATDRSPMAVTVNIASVIVIPAAEQIHIRRTDHDRPATVITPIHITNTARECQQPGQAQPERETGHWQSDRQPEGPGFGSG